MQKKNTSKEKRLLGALAFSSCSFPVTKEASELKTASLGTIVGKMLSWNRRIISWITDVSSINN